MIAQPAVTLLSHTFDRAVLFLVVFVLVDDWMHQQFGSGNLPRQTQIPDFTDSETLTIVLVGELCQLARQRAWLPPRGYPVRANHAALFPHLPEDSRFSRRVEKVRHLLPAFRRQIPGTHVWVWADADIKPVRLLDSFPLPLCANCRTLQSTQPISGTAWGYCASKKQYYFGLHPLALVTEDGFVDELVLAPGGYPPWWVMADSPLLNAFLSDCEHRSKDVTGQEWIADKGFVSKTRQAWAKSLLGLTLHVRQRDYGDFVPAFQRLLDRLRHPIEGFLSVLTQSFHLADMLVKTDIGIYRRVEAKITAFSLARYFNLVLGKELAEVARYAV